MINAILTGIFKLVIVLVETLLTPIDLIINNALPSVADGISYVNSFIDYILSFIPWVCSWFNFPQLFIDLVIAYFTFKLTVPLAVHTIKLALAWYDKIKP
ncbi:MAG: hypothetical protein E7168_01470 [Firmicutes bacterium]|nr:hypothetical protein [Bacillota bacterium]